MRKQIQFLSLAALLLLAAGCGKSPEEVAKEDAAKKLNDAGKQMEQAASASDMKAFHGGIGVPGRP